MRESLRGALGSQVIVECGSVSTAARLRALGDAVLVPSSVTGTLCSPATYPASRGTGPSPSTTSAPNWSAETSPAGAHSPMRAATRRPATPTSCSRSPQSQDHSCLQSGPDGHRMEDRRGGRSRPAHGVVGAHRGVLLAGRRYERLSLGEMLRLLRLLKRLADEKSLPRYSAQPASATTSDRCSGEESPPTYRRK